MDEYEKNNKGDIDPIYFSKNLAKYINESMIIVQNNFIYKKWISVNNI